MITVDQSFAVVTALLSNVDWSRVDYTLLEKSVVKNPKGAGRELTKFLLAGACMPLGDLKIATSPFDVKEFVGSNWKIVADEQDKRSQELLEVDFSKVELLTCLEGDESWIKGEEKLKRLKATGRIRYGATVFMGLWLDYKARGKDSVLERLYQERGITYMDFFGDVLEVPDGDRYALSLYRNADGAWDWIYAWLDAVWDASHVSAVSPQVS